MSDYTNVIFNKETGEVLIYESNDCWVLPKGYDLAHFENGVEPVFKESNDGRLYLKPNTIVVTDY